MSLRVDKDNIFFILPEDRYSISSRTDGMMDKDFTLYAKFKIFPEALEINKEAFAFSRNGMHSGISVTKVDENKCIINYSYWFVKTNAKGKYEYICKQIYYEFDINELNEFNEYVRHFTEYNYPNDFRHVLFVKIYTMYGKPNGPIGFSIKNSPFALAVVPIEVFSIHIFTNGIGSKVFASTTFAFICPKLMLVLKINRNRNSFFII